MKLKAVIFDLDGTVLDNERLYGAAFSRVLATLGKKLDEECPQTPGIGVSANWENLIVKCDIKTRHTPKDLTAQTHQAYHQLAGKIVFREGVIDLLGKLKKAGIKLALATSSTREIFLLADTRLSLTRYFDLVVTADDVTQTKPDPELFKLALKKLSVNPGESIVIEDSQAGIEAAHAANIKAVGIVSTFGNHKTHTADMTIGSFNDLSLNKLEQLIA